MRDRRSRRGFSLLEVMIALAILTTSLVILVETQSSAVLLTNEAEKTITATDLAQMKLTEALLRVEEEGFGVADVYESGEFDDLGDEVLDVEYGRELEEFHWEYGISEIDIDSMGDIASAASTAQSVMGGGDGAEAASGGAAGSPAMDALGALGFGPEQITTMLGPYIREVRVRVWWGEDSDQAEEDGSEIVITTHVINPTGVLSLEQGIPQ